jgi:hypothetical protein
MSSIMPEDVERAKAWRSEHKHHVKMLENSELHPIKSHNAYAPSGSDALRPELWRPPHWRWLREYEQSESTILRFLNNLR